jgi:hypothetical protein
MYLLSALFRNLADWYQPIVFLPFFPSNRGSHSALIQLPQVSHFFQRPLGPLNNRKLKIEFARRPRQAAGQPDLEPPPWVTKPDKLPASMVGIPSVSPW